VRLDQPGPLREALERALGAEGPCLIELVVD
jgi:thiamine pyrophosphate-dependent acetolactate synthase large subunit-like protein